MIRISPDFSPQQQIQLSLALRQALPEPVAAILKPDSRYRQWQQTEALRLLLAAQTQGCSLSLLTYLYYLYAQGRYAALQPWLQRAVSQALEEGNLYRLAQVYMLQGSAYACLNHCDLMLPCYTRALNLLQDSCFADQSFILLYNLGATYLNLADYAAAERYLTQAASQLGTLQAGQLNYQDRFLLYHKLALCYLRRGSPDQARPYFRQMREQFDLSQNPADWLRPLTAADLLPVWAPPKRLTEPNRLNCLSVEALMYEACLWESLAEGLKLPAFLNLMTVLLQRLHTDRHPGFELFYQPLMLKALRLQRRYKDALDLLASAQRYQ
ncbi:MAG: hypothetical protein PHR21_08585 [Oscillospiraceae bacterium]|nr:hypothetical protein [Oscillospiraceae bacterium]